MGKKTEKQSELFVAHTALNERGTSVLPGARRALAAHGFDEFARLCEGYYASKKGRPSLAPGVYFRCLLVGFFEGIDSERGIAWRVADSMSLRQFLGLLL